MSYQDFLAAKRTRVADTGPDVSAAAIHPMLHDWQAEIVRWAARTGRAAIWADTGLGKTVMQVEWLKHVAAGAYGLIVAPLAVCHQTVREAAKVGVDATYVRTSAQLDGPGIYVTNYEMVQHFDPAEFRGVVLDEASILKQSDGKTRTMLIRHFEPVPYRLACTATPAPNDPEELTNQAEFLGHMSRTHMLAAYFIHDNDGWRLKGHARGPMMDWMATWALAIRKPSDMGYSDDGYDLPGLQVIPHLIEVPIEVEGQLFPTDLGGVGGRAQVRRSTLTARVDRAVQLVHDCGHSPTFSGVHEGVLRVEQGKVEAKPRAAGGSERRAQEAVRRGQGVSGADSAPGGRVAEAAPTPAPSVDLWPHQGGRGADDRSGLRDLSCESARGRDGQDAHRSRPRDRHGPWCSLPAVQSGAGAPERRPDPSHGDVPLPHACVDQWVVWCGLNDEQDALAKALGNDCRSLDGRTSLEDRVRINEEWIRGDFRIILVKPGMYSQGMNWQHCARMSFVGLSDSYEQYYQAIRRCYRYGQTQVVHAHVVLSELEGQIAVNIARKERSASHITAQLVDAMRRNREGVSA